MPTQGCTSPRLSMWITIWPWLVQTVMRRASMILWILRLVNYNGSVHDFTVRRRHELQWGDCLAAIGSADAYWFAWGVAVYHISVGLTYGAEVLAFGHHIPASQLLLAPNHVWCSASCTHVRIQGLSIGVEELEHIRVKAVTFVRMGDWDI